HRRSGFDRGRNLARRALLPRSFRTGWRRSEAAPDAVSRDDKSCPASEPTSAGGRPARFHQAAPRIRVASSRHPVFGRPAMGAGRDRIPRDNAKATTAINAAVAPTTPALVQVGLSAFAPRSKSAISLARWDSAPAL